MKLTLIAAIGKNRELGKNNDMIWHLPQDLKFFRQQTSGHTIVMGRKTFESLPGKLPKRHHVVISRTCKDLGKDIEMCESVEEFMKRYKDADEEIYCIGGGMIYSEMLKYASRLVLTQIDANADAEVYFPEFDESLYNKKILSSIEENGVFYQHVEYTLK